MKISDILKRSKSDFQVIREKELEELKQYLSLYNNQAVPILARISFWEKFKDDKKQRFLFGIVKKFSLSRDRQDKTRLYAHLLISSKGDGKKFKTILKRKILLEDVIQIIPWRTSPRNNPFRGREINEEMLIKEGGDGED